MKSTTRKPPTAEALCAYRAILRETDQELVKDLLWGDIAVSGAAGNRSGNFDWLHPETQLEPPIMQLAQACEANDAMDVMCKVRFTNADMDWFAKLISQKIIMPQGTRDQLIEIARNPQEHRRAEEMPLASAKVSAVLTMRSALIEAMKGEDQFHPTPYLRTALDFRPINLEQSDSLMAFVKDLLAAFAEDFTKDKILWSENTLLWSQQRVALIAVLEDRARRFGKTFSFAPSQLGQVREGGRPIEALFALEHEGGLNILEMERDREDSLKFQIEYLLPIEESVADASEELTSSPKKKTKGKRALVKFRTRKEGFVLMYGNDKSKDNEHIPPKNSKMADICEKLYTSCQHVGSFVSPQYIYEQCNGLAKERPYFAHERKNWEWVYQSVRSFNRWAAREKIIKEKEELFSCDKERITRLL